MYNNDTKYGASAAQTIKTVKFFRLNMRQKGIYRYT